MKFSFIKFLPIIKFLFLLIEIISLLIRFSLFKKEIKEKEFNKEFLSENPNPIIPSKLYFSYEEKFVKRKYKSKKLFSNSNLS